MDSQQLAHAGDQRDGFEIPHQIVAQFRIQCLADRGGRAVGEQCVTVGGCARHQFRGDVAARAGAVIHDDGLAENFAHFGRDQSHRDIHARARREADQNTYRLCGIRLRQRGGGKRCRQQQHGGAQHHGRVGAECHVVYSMRILGLRVSDNITSIGQASLLMWQAPIFKASK